MAFTLTHLDGTMEQTDDRSRLEALLDELVSASVEHGDVAVSHESAWTLTVLRARVVWENVEDGTAPRHLDGLSRDETLDLMNEVAAGYTDAVEARPWNPGYGL